MAIYPRNLEGKKKKEKLVSILQTEQKLETEEVVIHSLINE